MYKIISFLILFLFISACSENKPLKYILDTNQLEKKSLTLTVPPNEKMRNLSEFTCFMSTMLFQENTLNQIKKSPEWSLFSLEVNKSNFEKIISVNIFNDKIKWLNLGFETIVREDGKIMFPENLIQKEQKYNNLSLIKDENNAKIKLIDERATCIYPFKIN
jgi:hypothetical protein